MSFPKKSDRSPLLFVRRTFILARCGKPLAADALLGVSSLDLGRLWQRRRPLYLVYFPRRCLPLIRC